MSNVTRDRELLKDKLKANFSYTEISMHKDNFSYINTFLQCRPKEHSKTVKKKISHLSTINILYSTYFSFQKIDKTFISKIEKIKEELKTRNDLFLSTIEFLENTEVIYDDLYFWHPNLKYGDVFSLIIEIIPNIVELYKEYLVEYNILGNNPKLRMLEIIKNRLRKNLCDFNVIQKDLLLFKDIDISEDRKERCNSKKSNKHQKDIPRIYKVVTGSYWTDIETEEDCKEVLYKLRNIELEKRYNQNIKLKLHKSLTYLDITINNKNVIVSMVKLNDLFVKNDRSKQFWMEQGIINERWEFI